MASTAMACDSAEPPGLDEIVENNGRHDAARIDYSIGYFTNQARCQNGLAPLAQDEALREAARIQTDNMATLDVFSHQTSAPGAETMKDRLNLAGVRYRRAAENIINGYFMQYVGGASYSTENKDECRFVDYESGRPLIRHTYSTLGKALVQRWMDSPGHRANILTPELTRQGAALAHSEEDALCGGLLATQVFAG